MGKDSHFYSINFDGFLQQVMSNAHNTLLALDLWAHTHLDVDTKLISVPRH